MSDGHRRRSGVLPVAALIGAVLLVVVAVVRLNQDDPLVQPPDPTPAPTHEPTSDPTGSAEPTLDPPGETRDPTDEDAADYAEGRDVLGLTVDITADGRKEVVFASVVGGVARIEIAVWDGHAYEIVYVDGGGSAERLDLTTSDYTGNGYREIVTLQSVGRDGQSLSIWGFDGAEFVPLRAQGGCWDGSHTFGVIGATIGDGEIVATCDGSPLPTSAWPADVYLWDGEVWLHDHTRTPGESGQ